MKRLFDIEPDGTREIFHFDDVTQQVTIQTITDAEPIIEANKRLFNQGDTGYSPSREMKRAANIPMGVVLLWRQRYGVDVFNRDHTEKVRKLLNDSEWRLLRTAPGRL